MPRVLSPPATLDPRSPPAIPSVPIGVCRVSGAVPERLKGLVSKTSDGLCSSVGSNPTCSAFKRPPFRTASKDRRETGVCAS